MALHEQLAKLDVAEAAHFLLGQKLVRQNGRDRLSGRIVETEAYHQNDPASHAYRGQTKRNRVMFGPPGRAYVYFTYGLHHCFNVTAGRQGYAAAILIRALEPLEGLEVMRQNRRRQDAGDLCSGPAKLTQALGITLELNSHDLNKPPLYLEAGETVPATDIVADQRIGISKATAVKLRFYIKDSPFVSKK